MPLNWLCVLDCRGGVGKIQGPGTCLCGKSSSNVTGNCQRLLQAAAVVAVIALGCRRVFSQPPSEGSGLQLGVYNDERVPGIK